MQTWKTKTVLAFVCCLALVTKNLAFHPVAVQCGNKKDDLINVTFTGEAFLVYSTSSELDCIAEVNPDSPTVFTIIGANAKNCGLKASMTTADNRGLCTWDENLQSYSFDVRIQQKPVLKDSDEVYSITCSYGDVDVQEIPQFQTFDPNFSLQTYASEVNLTVLLSILNEEDQPVSLVEHGQPVKLVVNAESLHHGVLDVTECRIVDRVDDTPNFQIRFLHNSCGTGLLMNYTQGFTSRSSKLLISDLFPIDNTFYGVHFITCSLTICTTTLCSQGCVIPYVAPRGVRMKAIATARLMVNKPLITRTSSSELQQITPQEPETTTGLIEGIIIGGLIDEGDEEDPGIAVSTASETSTTGSSTTEVRSTETSTTKIRSTEPSITGSSTSKVRSTETGATKIRSTDPSTTGSSTTEVRSTETDTTKIRSTDPSTTGSSTTEVRSTETGTTKIRSTEPSTTGSSTTEVRSTETGTTKIRSTEPSTTGSSSTEVRSTETGSTKIRSTEPSTTGSSTTEVRSTETGTTKIRSTEPSTTGSSSTEVRSTETGTTKIRSTEPSTTGSSTTEVRSTETGATKIRSTEPSTTGSSTTEVRSTETGTTKIRSTEPSTTGSSTTEVRSTETGTTKIRSTEPSTTGSSTTEVRSTETGTTKIRSTEPSTTVTKTTTGVIEGNIVGGNINEGDEEDAGIVMTTATGTSTTESRTIKTTIITVFQNPDIDWTVKDNSLLSKRPYIIIIPVCLLLLFTIIGVVMCIRCYRRSGFGISTSGQTFSGKRRHPPNDFQMWSDGEDFETTNEDRFLIPVSSRKYGQRKWRTRRDIKFENIDFKDIDYKPYCGQGSAISMDIEKDFSILKRQKVSKL